jgi:hypothetical protein
MLGMTQPQKNMQHSGDDKMNYRILIAPHLIDGVLHGCTHAISIYDRSVRLQNGSNYIQIKLDSIDIAVKGLRKIVDGIRLNVEDVSALQMVYYVTCIKGRFTSSPVVARLFTGEITDGS